MTSSFKEFEYMFANPGFLVIFYVIILIINWIINIISPYYFRKSKLEKLDEYQDKYIELNSYSEKTYVIDRIMEEEYGRILLNERKISKQRIMIFLLYYNLCSTTKEAKKFSTFLVFKESKQALIFDKSIFLKRIFFAIGTTTFCIGLCLFCKLQATEKLVIAQDNFNFEVIILIILTLWFYSAIALCVYIFCPKIGDSLSTHKLIKKNSRTIQKISSRLAELNTIGCQKKENIPRKNL